jgi:hypothetical protein
LSDKARTIARRVDLTVAFKNVIILFFFIAQSSSVSERVLIAGTKFPNPTNGSWWMVQVRPI